MIEGPERIGPYRVVSLLGSGGMGVVWRASAPDGTEVALKTLRQGFGEASLARLAREGLVRVEHPNVVRVLDVSAEPMHPYIAFELLEGESLEARLQRAPIAAAALVEVLAQAADGLAAVHAAGVVHRDLKPANVFLTSEGAVKLLDFGIAQLADGGTLTTTGTVLGTPAYLAPEQARGDRAVDGRADLWALGAIAFRALAGRPPFDRGSGYASLLAILLEPPPSLRSAAPGVPRSLAEIVDRCLTVDPAGRFAGAPELAEALRSADLAAPDVPAALARMPAGEQKLVAVLLAQGVLDHVALAAGIRAHGGEPVPLVGGDLTGLFGARGTEGDEAVRAVRAGIEIRHLARRVAVGAGRARPEAGTLGGAAVVAAERACGVELCGVGVEAETARLVAAHFVIEDTGSGIFEVVAERADDEAPPAGGPARRCVGRDAEIQRILVAFDEARAAGRSAVALVTGPPGIGKSVLLDEIALRSPGVVVLPGRGRPLRRESALSVFEDLLLRLARRAARAGGPRIDAHAPIAERRQAVLRLVREGIEEPARIPSVAAFIGELTGVPMGETDELRAAREDPWLMRDRLRLALVDWLAGLSGLRATLLVLEDLHWADAVSVELAEELVSRSEGRAPLVLASWRTDRAPTRAVPFARTTAPLHVELRGLSERDVGLLASSILPAPLPSRAVSSIARATGGNPLFVEQTVRALVDREVPVDEDARDLPLPLSVEAAIQARLDHLPERERELCRRASVMGRPFVPAEIESLGAGEVATALEALQRRELLEAVPVDGRPGARAFRSSLTAEVAYRSIAPPVRQAMHATLASWLAAQPEPDAEEVAHHHERGGATAAAGAWFARAAAAAFRRGDSGAVVRCSDRALDLGAPPEHVHDLHLQRADAFRFLGERARWGDELERALATAEGPTARARALSEKTAWLTRAGRLDEALATSAESVAAARALAPGTFLPAALARQAETLTLAGRFAEAAQGLEEAEALLGPAAGAALAKVMATHGLLATSVGDSGRARDCYVRAVALHRAAGDVRRAVFNEQNLADTYNRVGAYEEALRELGAALAGTRRVGNRLAEGYVLANIGYAQERLGRAAKALEAIDAAAALAQASGDVRLRTAVSVYRARALQGQGQLDEAAEVALAAAADACEHRQPAREALARVAAACGLRALGRLPEALEQARRAMELRDALGGIDEDEAEVFLELADALDATSASVEAEAVRTRGRARVEELATRIADPLWRARFLQDVAAHRRLLGAPGTPAPTRSSDAPR